MDDDPVARRMLAAELHRLNAGFVGYGPVLADVVDGRAGAAASRDGEHRFDLEAARRLAERLPRLLQHRLRVPVTLWEPHDLVGDAYVPDEAAQEALAALGEGSPRDGRTWLSVLAVRRLREAYPTLFQRLLH